MDCTSQLARSRRVAAQFQAAEEAQSRMASWNSLLGQAGGHLHDRERPRLTAKGRRAILLLGHGEPQRAGGGGRGDAGDRNGQREAAAAFSQLSLYDKGYAPRPSSRVGRRAGSSRISRLT